MEKKIVFFTIILLIFSKTLIAADNEFSLFNLSQDFKLKKNSINASHQTNLPIKFQNTKIEKVFYVINNKKKLIMLGIVKNNYCYLSRNIKILPGSYKLFLKLKLKGKKKFFNTNVVKFEVIANEPILNSKTSLKIQNSKTYITSIEQKNTECYAPNKTKPIAINNIELNLKNCSPKLAPQIENNLLPEKQNNILSHSNNIDPNDIENADNNTQSDNNIEYAESKNLNSLISIPQYSTEKKPFFYSESKQNINIDLTFFNEEKHEIFSLLNRSVYPKLTYRYNKVNTTYRTAENEKFKFDELGHHNISFQLVTTFKYPSIKLFSGFDYTGVGLITNKSKPGTMFYQSGIKMSNSNENWDYKIMFALNSRKHFIQQDKFYELPVKEEKEYFYSSSAKEHLYTGWSISYTSNTGIFRSGIFFDSNILRNGDCPTRNLTSFAAINFMKKMEISSTIELKKIEDIKSQNVTLKVTGKF